MIDRFRQLLVEHLGLSGQDFDQAVQLAQREQIPLLRVLERAPSLPPDKVLQLMAGAFNVPAVNLAARDLPTNIIHLLPRQVAQRLRVIPIDRAANHIVVATADPMVPRLAEDIKAATGYAIRPVLASDRAITQALQKYYGDGAVGGAPAGAGDSLPPPRPAVGFSGGGRESTRVEMRPGSDAVATAMGGGVKSTADGPVIQLVNTILATCRERGGSDIHIEPYESFMRVRIRIDGELQEIARPPLEVRDALVTRIKVMAQLKIDEKRLPQDGTISITLGNSAVEFRVNTLPTAYGEKVVMRLLDKQSIALDLTSLGFDEQELRSLKAGFQKPHGLVLVTGPTGSGKTTTLYAVLNTLNRPNVNISTAEDPVEYHLNGINQVHIKSAIGLDFAQALRAFLRQDPDIIMVGEIRDKETADIAVKAALTGHLVLSTLHTNNAPETIVRIRNMGVETYNLASALNVVTAQRLVKLICKSCKDVDTKVTPADLVAVGVPEDLVASVRPMVGRGCKDCNKSGTRGRTTITEIMLINDPIREAILSDASILKLKALAIEGGMSTLRQAAIKKMASGLISVAEVVNKTVADEEGLKSALKSEGEAA